jgi:hypothetical protein
MKHLVLAASLADYLRLGEGRASLATRMTP